MNLSIVHQDKFSRGQLILRTLFGWLYIGIPHGFILFFLFIWSAILQFVTFWVALFTAKFPESMFNYQVNLQRWSLRLSGSLLNLYDGYPHFGLAPKDEKVVLEVPRPERVSRLLVLLRTIFGVIYVYIPHGICLAGRSIAAFVVAFIAWWVVLFTGKYPEKWHGFVVGTYRWSTRLSLYMGYMTDEYPKFSGKP
ncbi:MAG TPA: DUF4389 domain-containing protein [Spirochaetia bacterium]|nr:DUF4389 domain-containing protein [Spirochaetia bacterium]